MADAISNRRKGARGYTPKIKTQPVGAVAMRGDEFLLIRKTKRPMPWANFIVWLKDPDKRKRSFHVGWNGERFNTGPEAEALREREPEVHHAVRRFLETNGGRYVREVKRRRRAMAYDPGHGISCSCYDCQEWRNEALA